ncbi:esterase [Herbaspirillum huttiense]|uniref:esterase n=1 Tax=Herbaspirillum huttiense TaxID=863372 RepID=UPI00040E27F3|nr:esterase [Herbaspirillum huttiense]
MKQHGAAALTLAGLILLAGCTTPASERAQASVAVAEVGSFHIGGRQATLDGLPAKEVRFTPTSPLTRIDPNGEFEVGQMYVQYVRLAPAARRAPYPLLMWHGGGLSGVTWESTPDGRPGWQMFFLRAGHDVYVSDAVERGRASWARYPELYRSEPVFRTKKEAWELFRIGPAGSYQDAAHRSAYPDTQFPVAAFDQFMKQGVPRWLTNDAATEAAYHALVQRVCPCVLMVHSQGSTFAYTLANRYPEKIKAVVGVEPSGALDPDKVDLTPLSRVPLLFVWGDKIAATPRWQGIQAPMKKMIAALKAKGGRADEIDLPARGIGGNSHLMMMDANSDQIAALVQDWLVAQGLAGR